MRNERLKVSHSNEDLEVNINIIEDISSLNRVLSNEELSRVRIINAVNLIGKELLLEDLLDEKEVPRFENMLSHVDRLGKQLEKDIVLVLKSNMIASTYVDCELNRLRLRLNLLLNKYDRVIIGLENQDIISSCNGEVKVNGNSGLETPRLVERLRLERVRSILNMDTILKDNEKIINLGFKCLDIKEVLEAYSNNCVNIKIGYEVRRSNMTTIIKKECIRLSYKCDILINEDNHKFISYRSCYRLAK